MSSHHSASISRAGTRRVPRKRSSNARLAPYQYLLLGSVVFSPLQMAFALDLGFPLKISEVLIMAAVVMYFFARHPRRESPLERNLFAVLAIIVAISSAFHLMEPEPTGELHGFSRSPTTDLALYFFYSMLVLVMWIIMSTLPTDRFRKAMILSIWVCAAAVFLQWALSQAGMIDVLNLLNYQTEAKGFSLESDEEVMRTGPFVEGQHLGFFSGMMFLIALRNRAWVAAGLSIYCLIYSQSTTGIIGVLAAVVILLVLRPRLNSFLRIIALGGAVAGIAMTVPGLRYFVTIQLAKLGLFGLEAEVEGSSLSRDLRSVKSDIGFQMMFDHPTLGVGPGRYAVDFFEYATNPPVPGYYWMSTHRAIAENVYAHVGSELGVLALIVFVIALASMLLKLFRGNTIDFAFGVYVAISITTQSAWTFIPIWIAFSYMGSVINENRKIDREKREASVHESARRADEQAHAAEQARAAAESDVALPEGELAVTLPPVDRSD